MHSHLPHYPLKKDKISDQAVHDSGGNFGRLARYGVMKDYGAEYGMLANRWTFYIGPDGKILYIDKTVKPASSGTDAVAKLKDLKVPPAKK